VIELFSLALMAEALLSEICRNWHFMKGWIVHSFVLCGQGPCLLLAPTPNSYSQPTYESQNAPKLKSFLSNAPTQGEEGIL